MQFFVVRLYDTKTKEFIGYLTGHPDYESEYAQLNLTDTTDINTALIFPSREDATASATRFCLMHDEQYTWVIFDTETMKKILDREEKVKI